jgi:hypothetical protein
MEPENAAGLVAQHLANCTDAQAAIVIDGNGDDVVAKMIEAGWTLSERVDIISGKRIRFLEVPR